MERNGGLITLQDLKNYNVPVEREPLEGEHIVDTTLFLCRQQFRRNSFDSDVKYA